MKTAIAPWWILAALGWAVACSSSAPGKDGTEPGSDASMATDAPGRADASPVGPEAGDAPSSSGDDSGSRGGDDAAGADAGNACAPASPNDGGVCNSLAATGAPVTVVCLATATLPKASGGPVSSGIYALASSTHYGPCPSAEQDRIVWAVCGDQWETLQEATTNGSTISHAANMTAIADGTSGVILQPTCGSPVSIHASFDATPTTLTLYFPDPSDATQGRVDVFARQ